MNLSFLNLQENIIKKLDNAKKLSRLSHAYIFSGDKGVGKNEVAHYFMCMLYCKEDKPCLKCDTCTKILNDNFLNLVTIYPDGKVIKKEQIQSLQEEFSKTSQMIGPRVYIIDDADKMNQSSQNSLLKFIEEPEPNIYGILLTTNKDLLLPTIISRCQEYHFNSLPLDALRKEMQSKRIDKKSASLISILTNDLDEAVSLYNDSEIKDCFNLFEKFLAIKNVKDSVIYLKENQSSLENIKILTNLITLLIQIYTDALKYKKGSMDLALSIYLDKIDIINENNSDLDLENKLSNLFTLKQMLDSNVSVKNVLANLFVSIL